MKKYILFFLSTFILLAACSDKKVRPDNAMDTGRAFIRATLDGDFESADNLLFKDSMNVGIFSSYKSFYQRLPEDTKKKYKEADYNINKFSDVNDSTTIINYANSYMKKPMEIKVIKKDGLWQIDFKYTSSGNLPID